MAHHGMTLQQAIDAPAFHTTHVPSSFAPRGRGFLFAGANPRGQPATARFLAERKLTAAPPDVDAQDLFEFYLERCLWTQTSGHGDWNPRHTIWRTARLLGPLERQGWVVLYDLAVPGCRANVDHLVIGPGGVFVVDSKQYSGRLQLDSSGRLWRGRYPLAPHSARGVVRG
jgi:hypothetical protein